MPVHIPQVPAGEDEWPEVLPNLLKYGEKEEDGEEKQGDDDDEEDIEGKRRDEEDIQDSLVEQKGMIVKFPLVPSCSSCVKILSSKKKFNNHIVKIQKYQTSWIIWYQITCHLPPCPVCQNSEITLART